MTSKIGINDYPSSTVRNFPKRAFLIDCDGGLGSTFHPRNQNEMTSVLIEKFPSDSDIFLFYNSNDDHILKRMKKLSSRYPRVHIFPNIITNSKNGADMNLAFVLGAINKKYDNYIIYAGHDRAYDEIKKRLETTDPRLEDHVELRRFRSPEELRQHICKFKLMDIQEEPLVLMIKSAGSPSTTIAFTPESLFHRCPLDSLLKSSRLYRFQELLDHLHSKHPNFRYEYCQTCEKMVQDNNWSEERCEQFNKHVQEQHLDNNEGFHLLIHSQ